jgi:hypothetical protein
MQHMLVHAGWNMLPAYASQHMMAAYASQHMPALVVTCWKEWIRTAYLRISHVGKNGIVYRLYRQHILPVYAVPGRVCSACAPELLV